MKSWGVQFYGSDTTCSIDGVCAASTCGWTDLRTGASGFAFKWLERGSRRGIFAFSLGPSRSFRCASHHTNAIYDLNASCSALFPASWGYRHAICAPWLWPLCSVLFGSRRRGSPWPGRVGKQRLGDDDRRGMDNHWGYNYYELNLCCFAGDMCSAAIYRLVYDVAQKA